MAGGHLRGAAYDARFDDLAARGVDVHGEADLVAGLVAALPAPGDGATARTVLDAGCGTGRVAIELARRGLRVVGLDVDPVMVGRAREKAPELDWRLADLASAAGLGVGPVDLAVLAGNVMIFVPPASEGRVLANVAAAVRPGGLVVAGFQLHAGGLDVATYDRHADAAGLRLVDRYATWDRAPFTGPPAPYAVSVHRRS